MEVALPDRRTVLRRFSGGPSRHGGGGHPRPPMIPQRQTPPPSTGSTRPQGPISDARYRRAVTLSGIRCEAARLRPFPGARYQLDLCVATTHGGTPRSFIPASRTALRPGDRSAWSATLSEDSRAVHQCRWRCSSADDAAADAWRGLASMPGKLADSSPRTQLLDARRVSAPGRPPELSHLRPDRQGVRRALDRPGGVTAGSSTASTSSKRVVRRDHFPSTRSLVVPTTRLKRTCVGAADW